MTEPEFDVQVLNLEEYAVMIMVDYDGQAHIRSTADPEFVGGLLTRMAVHFHSSKGLPMSVSEDLAQALVDTGWRPPNTGAEEAGK